ncbi:hypothetical protein ACGFYZ_14465 [Streptomyces sp. NPDC048330]|uniref:DUF7739 domain-containing protein n=1 Tax=Streptomyces sp. NPDC048330 TaxID=3365533 RepID=UPI0037134A97
MHLLTSHGADFFGEDRHPLTLVTALAGYTACLPHAEGRLLSVFLTQVTDTAANGTPRSLVPAQAAELVDPLRTLARARFIRSKPVTGTAALLAEAAARAAADGEPWTLTLQTSEDHSALQDSGSHHKADQPTHP